MGNLTIVTSGGRSSRRNEARNPSSMTNNVSTSKAAAVVRMACIPFSLLDPPSESSLRNPLILIIQPLVNILISFSERILISSANRFT
ncbi:unnamed protein product [Schistosoma mattheei]|uniref:Uncharacterized protein n=1 Tax=Schistosoma mattheei TaxID=31246 RepID=A0A3P8DT37_9TREM|nr:unnamed protein product [Schistosoma mattheei]